MWEDKTRLVGRSVVQTYPRVVENTGFKVLWDFNKQCDRVVEARGLDITFVHDKQTKEAKIIDIAIPGDARAKDKELEKIEKY